MNIFDEDENIINNRIFELNINDYRLDLNNLNSRLNDICLITEKNDFDKVGDFDKYIDGLDFKLNLSKINLCLYLINYIVSNDFNINILLTLYNLFEDLELEEDLDYMNNVLAKNGKEVIDYDENSLKTMYHLKVQSSINFIYLFLNRNKDNTNVINNFSNLYFLFTHEVGLSQEMDSKFLRRLYEKYNIDFYKYINEQYLKFLKLNKDVLNRLDLSVDDFYQYALDYIFEFDKLCEYIYPLEIYYNDYYNSEYDLKYDVKDAVMNLLEEMYNLGKPIYAQIIYKNIGNYDILNLFDSEV